MPIRSMVWRGDDLFVVAGGGSIRRLEGGGLQVVAEGDYVAAG